VSEALAATFAAGHACCPRKATLHESLNEERQDCLEGKVSEHHPPTPDRILANKG